MHTGVVAMTSHNKMPEPFILPTQSAYATGTMKLDVQVADIDMVANTFMRAPGESVGTFALRAPSAIDELAIELGMDPIELRLRNEPDKDPSTGLPYSSRHIVDAWRGGADRFGWEHRAEPGTRREGEWLIGTGCALGTYPYHRFPGGAARITLDKTGHATIAVPAADGMGDLDDPGDRHRRAAWSAVGACSHCLRRLVVPRQPACRRLVTDGFDRRRVTLGPNVRSSSNCSHLQATNRRWAD